MAKKLNVQNFIYFLANTETKMNIKTELVDITIFFM